MALRDAAIVIPSGLTNGVPIALTGSYQTIHEVGDTEEVFIWANNPTASDIDVSLKFGTAGTIIPVVTVPAKSTSLILPGVRFTDATATVLQMIGSGAYAWANVNRVS
jgi:hypothetical protein